MKPEAIALARFVLDVQKLGLIEGWRDHITHEQKQAGISNAELKAAIEQEKNK